MHLYTFFFFFFFFTTIIFMQFIFGCCPLFSYFLLLSIDMSVYPLLFIIVTASTVWTKYLPPNYNGSLPNFFS
jgi:hypothetical protein